ncbi:hypothetical protein [Reinekea blandensis]|uniref:Uncharacterized protein n=1 Tax=Reinekea blandensis MED297 TaxID=314283 RepID=A4BCY2_9GAMM|nr:hypothetical protein [Reinekea blandensis]EAR10064.1 hypothetical protein MED297_08246 [Reinekea sp. MED297] [Reinekea blandensis MED297]
MSDSKTHYAQLSHLHITDGAAVLPQTDRIDIGLANAQAGLCGFTEMDNWLTEADGSEYPILAAPTVDAAVMDDHARLSLLCQDLLPKLVAMELTPETHLVLTGFWPDLIVSSLQSALKLSTNDCIRSVTLAETLQQWEANCADRRGTWLWLSSHVGCGNQLLKANRSQLACSARSEGIYSTDLITAIMFEHKDQPAYFVAQATEPASDDPLQKTPQALRAITQSLHDAYSRPLLHGLPVSAATEIELYRFRQANNAQPNGNRVWPDPDSQNDIALAATIGTPGVCALPLAMLFHHYWNGHLLPVCIAHEGMERFTWSRTAS